MSDFIFYIIVVAGFSLRFSASDGCIWISRKLRNLKDAATQIAQFRFNILLKYEGLGIIELSPSVQPIASAKKNNINLSWAIYICQKSLKHT